ncbi:hypothetical protein D3C79_872540 [compost metagenome]
MHTGAGGWRKVAQALQRWTSSRPSAQPSQKNRVSSLTPGNGRLAFATAASGLAAGCGLAGRNLNTRNSSSPTGSSPSGFSTKWLITRVTKKPVPRAVVFSSPTASRRVV